MSADELPAVAQTNLQLYNRLRRAGFPEAELVRVRGAYEQATELFAGMYRGTGKPFVCHLVGVAAIVAEFGGGGPAVAAAILHSVYKLGEFGNGRRRITEARRRRIRDAIGTDAEELVLRYTREPEGTDGLLDLARAAGSDRPADPNRDLLMIRLADAAEDLVDSGSAYCRKAAPIAALGAVPAAALDAECRRLGLGGLWSFAAELIRRAGAEPGVEALRCGRTRSYTVAPLSHRLKTTVRLRRWFS